MEGWAENLTHESNTPLMEGHFGSYQILSLLGRGGMGEVYRAHDPKLGRDIALKVLPRELAQDPDRRVRLLREARAAASLSHSNICTIYEVGEADGQAYLAMEFIDGEPLDRLIPSGGLPIGDVLRYALHIVDAVAHAHARGIAHRDLKPSNVLVTRDRRAKVLDFGLARRLSEADLLEATTQVSLTQPGTLVGTLAYMAPEQLRGQRADSRSDIWALGVMLHEMATGERPFQGQTTFELSSAILNQAPAPLPAKVGDELNGVIESCLEKDPEKRYQRATDVQTALEAIQAGSAVPRALSPSRRRRRRGLTVVAMTLVAMLLVVLGARNYDRLRTGLSLGSPRIRSLAVLPFENLSGSPDQEYIADGIHEAIIIDLSKLAGLERVIARPSAMRYQKSGKALTQIARELGVDAVITGSVLPSGDRVQVTVHLVNGATEEQIWADRYERAFRDVLALENDITGAITSGIKLRLTPEEQQRLAGARPVNVEAFDTYLKGRFYAGKFTPEGFERGLDYLRQAVDKDPTNASAWGQLAVTYSMVGHDKIPDAFAQAKAAARRALDLDPASAEAHEVLGEIKLYSDWDDWPGAETNFRQALALNPNLGFAHRNYSWYLNVMGRAREGIAEIKRARDVDPLVPMFAADLGWQYWDVHELDKATDEARKSLDIDPNFPWAYTLLGLVHAERGHFTEAIAAHLKAAQSDPEMRGFLAQSYARAGNRQQALRLIAEIQKQPSPLTDWGLAEAYASLGNREEMLHWLARGFQDRFSLMPWLRLRDAGLERPFLAFRSDPRYQDLLRRMNLAEETQR